MVSASATVAPAPLSGARGCAAPKVKPKARSGSGSGSVSGSAIGGTDLPIETAAVLPVTLTSATKQRRRGGADGASDVPGAGETGDKASPKETAPRKRRRDSARPGVQGGVRGEGSGGGKALCYLDCAE